MHGPVRPATLRSLEASDAEQVGIVGAGPAGLLLSHLLHLQGIESILLEARSRDYVENRIRAGVLEFVTEKLLNDSGVGERMRREGLLHPGAVMRFGGADHRVDFADLVGKGVMVYSQHNVVQDLIAARLSAGGQIVFQADNVSVHDFHTEHPYIRYHHGGAAQRVHCDIIAGCDGFHGVCRASIPPDVQRGFALLAMRSPALSRLYLQCALMI